MRKTLSYILLTTLLPVCVFGQQDEYLLLLMKPVKVIQYFSDDQIKNVTIFAYDSFGHMTQETASNADGTLYYSKRWHSFYDQNRLIKSEVFINGKKTGMVQYLYTQNVLSEVKYYRENIGEQPLSSIDYFFDQEKLLKKIIHYSERVEATCAYRYDQAGNLVKLEFYDGDILKNRTMGYEILFYIQGKVSKAKHYDERGILLEYALYYYQ